MSSINSLFDTLKKHLYFVYAYYFKLWASIALRRWDPKIIAVTGSSGKTTLLNMLDAQIGDISEVSHHANSTFGIPFNILKLPGIEGSRMVWLINTLKAPIRAFSVKHKQANYIVEIDAERPGEAPFLAKLLTPDITLWVSSSRTHASQFDKLVSSGKYKSVDEAVAEQYADVCKHTKEKVIANGDNHNILASLKNIEAELEFIELDKVLKKYSLTQYNSKFELKSGASYEIPQLVPVEVAYQIAMMDSTLKRLKIDPDYKFKNFRAPPGRSSIFNGIKNTKLLDSSYNSNLSSLEAVLHLFKAYSAEVKWAVIGDMVEQGKEEDREHQKIAPLLKDTNLDRVIFYGPRVIKNTLPEFKKLCPNVVTESFDNPKEVLTYLEDEIKGGEAILFKGARFLEGVIEKLLEDKTDISKLARQTSVWKKRRSKWGL